MILWESLLLSVGGAVVGSIAAVLLTRFLSKMPMTSELIEGKIAPIIIIEGFLLALLVGFAGVFIRPTGARIFAPSKRCGESRQPAL